MVKIETNQKGWKFVGARLCLDFVNTVGGRYSATVLREKLADYTDLLQWSQLAGNVNRAETRRIAQQAAAHRTDAQTTLARAILLREALYRIFTSAVEGRRPARTDLDILSREVAVARSRQRLAHSAGAFCWTWEDKEVTLSRLLWPIALSAADLLTSSDLSKLRQCGGNDCGWLFLDTSRNRSRQWCDMRDCGNLAKVRRFRERQRASHARRRA
jgi:predicted RNA-binding Zn ribbon-like protein